MKILIVDDDPDIAEIVAFALGKDQHHCTTVHGGTTPSPCWSGRSST